MADLKLGNILPVGADNVVVDGKYVKGSYVTVATLDERDSLKGSDGQNIVNGSLCYCQEDSKFYQYDGENWQIVDFIEGIPLTTALDSTALQANVGAQAAARGSTAFGNHTATGVKCWKISHIDYLSEDWVEIYLDTDNIDDSNPDGNTGCASQLIAVDTEGAADPRFKFVHFLHQAADESWQFLPAKAPTIASFSATNASNWSVEYANTEDLFEIGTVLITPHPETGYDIVHSVHIKNFPYADWTAENTPYLFLQGNPFYHKSYYDSSLTDDAAYYLEDCFMQGPQVISLTSTQIKACTNAGMKIGTSRYNSAHGHYSTAISEFAISEGNRGFASAVSSYSSGKECRAYAPHGRASGELCKVEKTATASISEGFRNIAKGQYSRSTGANTLSEGTYSEAHNYGTIAQGTAQTVHGRYNIPDSTSLFIIGNGSKQTPSNALTVDMYGNLDISGKANVATPTSADLQSAVNIEYLNKVNIYKGTDGLVYSNKGTYATCKGFNDTASIPESVTIAAYYQGLPVTQIESDAFWNTFYYPEVELNKFAAITELIIPNTVTYIAGGAFLSCVNLSKLTISRNLKTVGSNAFAVVGTGGTISSGATKISEIIMSDGGIEDFCAINFVNKGANPLIVSYQRDLTTGVYNVATINGSAVKKLPSSLYQLGGWTVAGNKYIVEADLSNITEWRFDGQQFNGCAGLTEIKLPRNTAASYIPQYCFQSCKASKLTIPSNITHIYYNALKLSTACTITLESSQPPYLHNGPTNTTFINPFNYSDKYIYTFRVPQGSLETYKDADNKYGWKDIYESAYTVFEEYDPNKVENVGITEAEKLEIANMVLDLIADGDEVSY